MRPVDADEIVKRCEDVIRHGVADNAGQHRISAECVMSAVKALPTVDAVPVKHGRWVRVYSRPGVFKYLGWTCDQCGQRTGIEYAPQWYKFCPNCGARMDGKDGEGNG